MYTTFLSSRRAGENALRYSWFTFTLLFFITERPHLGSISNKVLGRLCSKYFSGIVNTFKTQFFQNISYRILSTIKKYFIRKKTFFKFSLTCLIRGRSVKITKFIKKIFEFLQPCYLIEMFMKIISTMNIVSINLLI